MRRGGRKRNYATSPAAQPHAAAAGEEKGVTRSGGGRCRETGSSAPAGRPRRQARREQLLAGNLGHHCTCLRSLHRCPRLSKGNSKRIRSTNIHAHHFPPCVSLRRKARERDLSSRVFQLPGKFWRVGKAGPTGRTLGWGFCSPFRPLE